MANFNKVQKQENPQNVGLKDGTSIKEVKIGLAQAHSAMTYHMQSIKQTHMYGNSSISSPDVRSFYRQPSSIANYHGSAMSAVKIRYQKSYYKMDWSRCRGRPRKSWIDSSEEWTGQSISSLLRTSQMTEVNGQPS